MKFRGSNASTLFCEQVSTVTSLFQQWNECERTVVMYALLKRLPFANLKFLQISIECNLQQNFSTQTKLQSLEANSNNTAFLQKLVDTYKNIQIDNDPMVKDSMLLYNSVSSNGSSVGTGLNSRHQPPMSLLSCSGENLTDSGISNVGTSKYDKKEDILNEILTCLPLLRPGNEDAKAIYLSLIPMAVEDTMRQLVNTEHVQHIFSYLLIHPAITSEDRRSLSQWLRRLEDHIQSTYTNNNNNNTSYFMPPYSRGSSFSGCSSSNSTSSSTTSGCDASSLSNISNNSNGLWNTMLPPPPPPPIQTQQQPQQQQHVIQTPVNTDWDFRKIQAPKETDFISVDTNDFSKAVGKGIDFKSPSTLDTSTDDHHVSFSKNGTEIPDFDAEEYDISKSNAHVAFDPSLNDYLRVPGTIDISGMSIKTRRSNSLTTTVGQGQCYNQCSSSSTENLSNIAHKPRSYSLSIETPRSALTSSGSETRLDDIKMNYTKFTTHNIGMSNIGQWLKSLRLHKYVWLFSNLSYDQMMDITEEHLQTLGVTKGARHKLVLCIQKLKERWGLLQQFEQELISGVTTVAKTVEELYNIVLTPMRPVENFGENDVAGQLLKVVDLVCNMATNKSLPSQEEETVNALLWVLERALHSESFVAHTNQLKELKFKISKLKIHFPPKAHYSKALTSGNGINKQRWTPNQKQHKSSSGSCEKPSHAPHRKNSNTMTNFSVQSFQTQYQQQQQQEQVLQLQASIMNSANQQPSYYVSQSPSGYSKSSSYPTFVNNNNNNNNNNNQKTSKSASLGNPISQASPMVAPSKAHNGYHRHSLHNLITVSQPMAMPQRSTSSVVSGSLNNSCGSISNNTYVQQLQQQHQQSQHKAVIQSSSRDVVIDDRIKPSVGDINSSLEFLCLQMTEQAIN